MRTATETEIRQRGCTYKAFLGCNPCDFNGTEGAVGIMRWIEKMENVLDISGCANDQKVKYATCTLSDEALTWWNSQFESLGREGASQLFWEQLKILILEEYCSRNELQKIEAELWNLTMVGSEVIAYTTRFNELACLVPHLVNPEYKRIEKYVWGLAPQIRSMVISSKPATIKEAISLAYSLTDEAIRMGLLPKKGTSIRKAVVVEEKKVDNKRKWEGKPKHNIGNRGFKKKEAAKACPATNVAKPRGYIGTLPKCAKCGYHHTGGCTQCDRCKKYGHKVATCRVNLPPTEKITQACYECGEVGHFKKDCPKLKNQNQNPARGEHLCWEQGTPVRTQMLSLGCILTLEDHSFDIDLLPVELGSFDIVIGMDWLSKNHAEIVCHEKLVRIPLSTGETLVILGEKKGAALGIITCMKARKYLRKGCYAFLAHIVEKKPEEHRLEDIPIVRDFPKVFPEDLPRLLPARQIEFRIDLLPGAAPVARSPYRLAPSEMQELSNQLQELLDKSFIRLSYSP
ncbi:uncharacterized protein LOC143551598 [Bidens hawaiensis]|uniref:uncharacterized protein LOC143551598 n=1 Tax=Bidens hawaiensis TaxID=980011 RepID=UPI00404B6F66